MATKTGTSASETINGTSVADILYGRGGNDVAAILDHPREPAPALKTEPRPPGLAARIRPKDGRGRREAGSPARSHIVA